MKTPKTKDEYFEYFNGDSQKKNLAAALDRAIEERRFEIDLYWRRAAYFWTFIGAAFAAYFLLERLCDPDSRKTLTFMVGCLGFLFSLAWHLANRGSKFWQEFWEHKVELLENEVMGPLYKSCSNRSEYDWWHLLKSYPFSVSKINQILALTVCATWLILAFRPWLNVNSVPVSVALFGTMTVAAVIVLVFFGVSRPERDIHVAVSVREVHDNPVDGETE